MIVLTREEPLGPNGFRHAVDDASGKIVNSNFTNASLNRYSFLIQPGTDTQPDQDIEALIVQLLEELARQINTPATWVDAWKDHSGDLYTPTRARTAAHWHRKDGYSVYEEPGETVRPQLSLGMVPRLSVAAKSLSSLHNLGNEELEAVDTFRGGFLIFGALPPLEAFTGSHARTTMFAYARRRRLTPSDSFLSWIAEQHLSLIYQGHDERGYFVLIVVVPKHLDINALLTQGLVDKISTEPMY